MNRYFADISNNNTQNMNFEAYRKKGKHVLLGHKATEGTGFTDRFHAERCERAHKAGSWVLHYHFGHAGESPGRQAEFFWNTIKHHFAPLDVACIDIEQGGALGHSAMEVAGWLRTFDQHFTEFSNGHHLKGYSDESFLEELLARGGHIHGQQWWIAAYGSRKPSVRGVRMWAWQFTDGSIGPQPHEAVGIGRCDMSSLNRATYLRMLTKRPPA